MFKTWFPESKDHIPLTWWKTHPIYLAAIVALAGVASMIVTALLGVTMVTFFAFSFPSAFSEWHLWTPLTYVLVNAPSIWTLIGFYMLWKFGEAIERHLGRRAFVRLLALLILSSPLFITLLHLLGMHGAFCAGMSVLGFGVFIAFATLYSHTKLNLLIITIDTWLLATILVGISVLQCLFARDWASFILLAANVSIAYAFIRYEQGELKFPSIPRLALRPSKPASATKTNKPAKPAGPKTPTVDDILDKISHKGMHSLTPEERRILDKASEEMKRRAN